MMEANIKTQMYFVYAEVSKLRCVLSDRVHNRTGSPKLYAELFMRKGQCLER